MSVFDARSIRRNELIGSFQFDVSQVYLKEHHEVYKQWVGLVDEKNEEDAGCQGYLQLSVVVLGPGDRQYLHKEEESADVAGDDFVASLVMMPPTIKQELHFLVVTIHKVKVVEQACS